MVSYIMDVGLVCNLFIKRPQGYIVLDAFSKIFHIDHTFKTRADFVIVL